MKDFKVRCVESRDSRFKVNKIYEVNSRGKILDEDGSYNTSNLTTESFEKWLKDGNWTDYKFELVTEPTFTKADLRTGMRVETKEGTRYIVFVEAKKLSNGRNWLGLDGISEDLTDKHNADDYSIFKVFNSPFNPAYLINVNEVGKLLYQRTEPLLMTHKEIETELGHEFEYVKE